MKIKKLTILTSDLLTINQELERYYNLDMIHPSKQLETLLVTLQNPQSEHIIIKTRNDSIISHINNIILSTEHNIHVPIYKNVVLERQEVEVLDDNNQPCVCGKYGFEVPWMTTMLNELFDITVAIQEKVNI